LLQLRVARNSEKQKGTTNDYSFPGENFRSFKPLVKTGNSTMKPTISSSSEFVVCWGSEDENGWWEESEDAGDAEC